MMFVFSDSETRAEDNSVSSRGNRSNTLGDELVEFLDGADQIVGLLGRAQQRLGVYLGNVFDAHVGLDLGGGSRVVGSVVRVHLYVCEFYVAFIFILRPRRQAAASTRLRSYFHRAGNIVFHLFD